jgi:hypothetical protein
MSHDTSDHVAVNVNLRLSGCHGAEYPAMWLPLELNTSSFAPVRSEGGDIAPLTAADQERGMANDNPNQTTSEQRIGEVAAILGTGSLRLRQHVGVPKAPGA